LKIYENKKTITIPHLSCPIHLMKQLQRKRGREVFL